MSLFGNAVFRTEDPRLLTSGGEFVGDRAVEGYAHVVFVRSTTAHGLLKSIEVDAAVAAPGVLSVMTSADIDLGKMPQPIPLFDPETDRPLLAIDRVRHVGELIAVVVAESVAQAQDAAELVVVEYEPLPVVTDVTDARSDEVLLFEELGTNTVFGMPPTPGEASFDDCDVVVEFTMTNQRLAPCPIEARVSTAEWSDGRLTQYIGTQGVHPVRDQLAQIYGLEPSDVRVVTPDVGGGFGARAFAHSEEILLGAVSKAVGRPVRWAESRTENLQAMVHGRAQRQHIRIGGSRDGQVIAFAVQADQDAGAYPHFGAFLPMAGLMMLTGVYNITNAEFSFASVVTNTMTLAAYRGAGRPEATGAIERAIDYFAAEIGMDPAEVREVNLLAPFSEGHTTVTGTSYDSGNYPEALESLLGAVGYTELRADQLHRRDSGESPWLGIGLSVYVEVTALGTPGEPMSEYGSVELQADGSVIATTGSSPHGQGHYTSWAMLISDEMGIPMDLISVVHGDTDRVPEGGSTGGSRSAQIAGNSIQDAAKRLIEKGRELAADHLEAAFEDIVLDTDRGIYHVAGSPALGIDWVEIAAKSETLLSGVSEFSQQSSSFPFGAHCAIVEVDPDTGKVTLGRMVAVDDCGTMINPLIVEGQVHGGLAQGIAQALQEEVQYDEFGNLLTSNFVDYNVISAPDLPSFERVPMETPSPLNPLGAKGIGEAATIGSTAAVHNAVIDALSHIGVRHIDMPCTSEKVWQAIKDADLR